MTMARPLRILAAGALYHVTSRGDGREQVFFSDYDRRYWLELLGEVCERYDWLCHAYCQMGNHYHLVVETPRPNLSAGMRHLNGVYTQYINRSQRRVGHVYQGRFHSILVEKEAYFLTVCRYVVLNPVRANLVTTPVEWEWSSFRSTAAIGESLSQDWFDPSFLLSHFGTVTKSPREAFVDYVLEGVGDKSIWRHLHDQIYLGDRNFVTEAKQRNSIESIEIPHDQRHCAAKPISFYSNAALPRKRAMADAYASGDFTLAQIALEFRVHYTTVSKAIKFIAASEPTNNVSNK